MRPRISPLDDLTYDVMTVLQNKAKALEAYAKYIEDASEDEEVRQAFEDMRLDDTEHVRTLKEILARRLDEDLGDMESEDEDEEEDEDDDDLQAGAHRGEAIAHAKTEPAPRRGESTHRR